MNEPEPRSDAGLFYCPLRSAVHPEVDAVAERSLAWMTRFELVTNERQRRRLMATNSAEFYGRITPAGLAERLQIAADWCYWGFAFDDAWSDAGTTKPRAETLLVLAGRMLRMLETRDARVCGDDPLLLALHDVVVRFSRCASPVQLRRWIEAHRMWLFGMVQRHAQEASGTPPGVDAYLTMRLHDCGGAPCTTMMDIVDGTEVSSQEVERPAIRALTEAAWLVAALDNERVSHAKEIHAEGAVQSLVSVLMHERGCSEPQALVEAVAMRDRVMSLFLRLYSRVAPRADAALGRYLADLAHLIPGNLVWSFKTARYTTVYDAGAAPIGSLALTGGWTHEPTDGSLAPLPLPSIAWWWEELD